MKEKILQFIIDNWETITSITVPLLYELLARWIPTEKNRSIVDNVVKLLNIIVKNRRKPQPEDEADITETKNRVFVDRSKHIIPVVLFFLLSVPAFAQPGFSTTKGIHFVNVLDSTTVFPVNGTIYYNEQSHKFRVYENNAWHDLGSGGGGGGGGITNGAAVNELPKTTDGSGNLGTSGIASTSAGNLNFGLSTTSGTSRTIAAAGSGANVGLTFTPKGAGNFTVSTSGLGNIILQTNGAENTVINNQSASYPVAIAEFRHSGFTSGVEINAVNATTDEIRSHNSNFNIEGYDNTVGGVVSISGGAGSVGAGGNVSITGGAGITTGGNVSIVDGSGLSQVILSGTTGTITVASFSNATQTLSSSGIDQAVTGSKHISTAYINGGYTIVSSGTGIYSNTNQSVIRNAAINGSDSVSIILDVNNGTKIYEERFQQGGNFFSRAWDPAGVLTIEADQTTGNITQTWDVGTIDGILSTTTTSATSNTFFTQGFSGRGFDIGATTGTNTIELFLNEAGNGSLALTSTDGAANTSTFNIDKNSISYVANSGDGIFNVSPSLVTLTTVGDIFIAAGAGPEISTTGNVLNINPAQPVGITFDAASSEIILRITRTSCAGAPSGTLAKIAGVLNVCP